MTRRLEAMVLPAYEELPGLPSEVEPWLDARSFTRSVTVDGLDRPVRCTDDGIGLLPTGVGKVAAATTVTAVVASDAIDLNDALVVSAGIAGGPPDQVDIGDIVVAESIVDWDNKLRFDRPRAGAERSIEPNPYNAERAVIDLDPDAVGRTVSVLRSLDVAVVEVDTEVADPAVHVGTNLCGDELFHGDRLAEEAAWLVDRLDRGPYLVTEMEDIGTAVALDRFDRLDRYVSVRAVANFDRSTGGSAFDDTDGLAAGTEVALSTLVPAVSAVIDDAVG